MALCLPCRGDEHEGCSGKVTVSWSRKGLSAGSRQTPCDCYHHFPPPNGAGEISEMAARVLRRL